MIEIKMKKGVWSCTFSGNMKAGTCRGGKGGEVEKE
jgi:hypothetical protein